MSENYGEGYQIRTFPGYNCNTRPIKAVKMKLLKKMTYKQIGKKLGVTDRTIQSDIKKLKEKCNKITIPLGRISKDFDAISVIREIQGLKNKRLT